MNEYNEDEFIIGTMTHSFSRLKSFHICPYAWKRHYIECEPTKHGFYDSSGGFAHKTLEKYETGELDIWDLSSYFEEHFAEEVPYDAPPNKYKDLKQDWYDKVLEYFDNIDLPLDEYNVMGVEKKVEFKIDKYPFIGFIDLFLQDPTDGKFILCDHKSSSIKILKSGAVSKSDQEHFLDFRRQQYLYCKPIIEEYGDGCVKELWWNMFRDRNWIKIPFNKDEYQEALDWALDTIHQIENETEWSPNPSFFYCNYLCGINVCEYKP